MIPDNEVKRKRHTLDEVVSSQQDKKMHATDDSNHFQALGTVNPSSTSDEDGQIQVKSRSEGSNPQSLLTDISTEGLLFISKVNKVGRNFIPSTKNFFGGIQVRKVLCDTGCSTTLLPIEEGRVRELFETSLRKAPSLRLVAAVMWEDRVRYFTSNIKTAVNSTSNYVRTSLAVLRC